MELIVSVLSNDIAVIDGGVQETVYLLVDDNVEINVARICREWYGIDRIHIRRIFGRVRINARVEHTEDTVLLRLNEVVTIDLKQMFDSILNEDEYQRMVEHAENLRLECEE